MTPTQMLLYGLLLLALVVLVVWHSSRAGTSKTNLGLPQAPAPDPVNAEHRAWQQHMDCAERARECGVDFLTAHKLAASYMKGYANVETDKFDQYHSLLAGFYISEAKDVLNRPHCSQERLFARVYSVMASHSHCMHFERGKDDIMRISRQFDQFVNEFAEQEGRTASGTFQERVHDWLVATFEPDYVESLQGRLHAFAEESAEFRQALGYTREQEHAIIDMVYNKPSGKPPQECGGTMTTLAALCHRVQLNMIAEGERELAANSQPEEMVRIRAKCLAKVRPKAPTT
jgi:hypothetical protein